MPFEIYKSFLTRLRLTWVLEILGAFFAGLFVGVIGAEDFFAVALVVVLDFVGVAVFAFLALDRSGV